MNSEDDDRGCVASANSERGLDERSDGRLDIRTDMIDPQFLQTLSSFKIETSLSQSRQKNACDHPVGLCTHILMTTLRKLALSYQAPTILCHALKPQN